MAKAKKVSRKELLKEPDEFLTFSRKLLNYIMANKKPLIGIAAGILLLLVIVAAVQYIGYRSENRAFALLSEVWGRYEAAVEEKTPAEAYGLVEGDFQTLLEGYGGTEAGKMGRVMYANIAYEAGKSDQAVKLYNAALAAFEGDPALKNLILSGLGYAHEQQQAYQASVDYFERIVAGESPVLKSEAYYNLGRLYALLGDSGKSREAYEKILSDYGDSIYADLVKDQLAG
jgi:tetratricopeptide (TPR) repeat protein